MRPVAFFCCLLAAPCGFAGEPSLDPQPVTVLMEFTGTRSAASLSALKSELQTILSDSHLKIDLELKSDWPDTPVSGDLLLFKLKGACTMNAVPIGALSDERGPLAMTHAVNGELLPFGEVECDRVRTALQRTVGRGNPEAHQAEYGIALARVMAHEIYHMLEKSAAHTKDGLSKEALSSLELSRGNPRLLIHTAKP
jgi:hypothetical protein